MNVFEAISKIVAAQPLGSLYLVLLATFFAVANKIISKMVEHNNGRKVLSAALAKTTF